MVPLSGPVSPPAWDEWDLFPDNRKSSSFAPSLLGRACLDSFVEKDCESHPGSAGKCHDQLAMSATGEEKGAVQHSSHDHKLPEVSAVAFYGALSHMYEHLGAAG